MQKAILISLNILFLLLFLWIILSVFQSTSNGIEFIIAGIYLPQILLTVYNLKLLNKNNGSIYVKEWLITLVVFIIFMVLNSIVGYYQG